MTPENLRKSELDISMTKPIVCNSKGLSQFSENENATHTNVNIDFYFPQRIN